MVIFEFLLAVFQLIYEQIIKLWHHIIYKQDQEQYEEEYHEYEDKDQYIVKHDPDKEALSQSIIDDIDDYMDDHPIQISKVKMYENKHYKNKTEETKYKVASDEFNWFENFNGEKFRFDNEITVSKAVIGKKDDSYRRFKELENKVRSITSKKANFSVLEYDINLAVDQKDANAAYLKSKSGVHSRQLMVNVEDDFDVDVRKGAMNFTAGNVDLRLDFRSIRSFLTRWFIGLFIGEKTIYTTYYGDGHVVFEPTTKHILLLDIEDYGEDGLVIERGMYLGSDHDVKQKWRLNHFLTGLLGGEGFYNQVLSGKGAVALLSNVPMDQLIVLEIHDEKVRLDGHFAVMWSGSLDFKVELAKKRDIFTSKFNDEDLVDVFEGTGIVYLSPVANSIYTSKRKEHVKYLDNEKAD